MNVTIDLPADYKDISNDFYMMAKRCQTELEASLPKLQDFTLNIKIVERHLIPFTSGVAISSNLSTDGALLSVKMLMHRIVPANRLKELFSTELKKLLEQYY